MRPERSLQMVDLHSQYQQIKTEVDQAIQNVITDSAFIGGKYVTAFEQSVKSYLNAAHVVPCGNGTDALQLALMALDLQPGDEVILPAFTFVAPAEAVALLGLTPVFADVDLATFNITAETIERHITKKTKAIIVVHLFGQTADMLAIMELAKKFDLKVIEDVAQAFGAKILMDGKWEMAGTIGDIGCTSFFPSKNLACFGDGGAVYTNNEELAKRTRMFANHGQPKKYTHDLVGINSRLDGIQAAILNVKIKYLDQYIASRRKVAETYHQLLAAIEWIVLPTAAEHHHHTYNQYTIKLKPTINREDLIEYLKENGIPSMVYYGGALQHQTAYQKFKQGILPNSEVLSHQVLSLPMHTELTFTEQKKIGDLFTAFK
jgi:UDP-2-acetamido-2-deoxy-ribo-hexuluronate aminotransferase